MSTIFQSLIKKEVLHLVRDFRTVTVVLVMPVVLLLLFGFAISTEVNNVNVAVVVERHTDETRQAIDRLRANPYFTFCGIATHSEVEELLRKGKVDAAVVLRTENGKPSHQVIVDASNTTMAQTSTAYIESVISNSSAGVPVVANTLYNPQLKSAYHFVPGIMGMIFILICAMMTSVSIVNEKETGTMNLLLVSPVRPRTIIQRGVGHHPLYSACPLAGAAHLHHRLHAGRGTAGFGRYVHDSRGAAVGHDFPCGEYALAAAMAFMHNPGSVVHLGHACAYDTAAASGLRAHRGFGTPGNDAGRLGLGHKEIQR